MSKFKLKKLHSMTYKPLADRLSPRKKVNCYSNKETVPYNLPFKSILKNQSKFSAIGCEKKPQYKKKVEIYPLIRIIEVKSHKNHHLKLEKKLKTIKKCGGCLFFK